MLERVFLSHPRSLDETYLEHQKAAFGFAGSLFLAACACALHGVAPALCVKTGSTMISRLHDQMVSHRRKPAQSGAAVKTQAWADYAI